MNTVKEIAKHIRQVHFGGNWTSVNLRDTLADVDWQQATAKIASLNTIAALVYHSNYYISEILKVLNGAPLTAHDSKSFLLPAITSQEDWDKLLTKTWQDAESFASAIEQLSENKLPGKFY